MLRRLLLFATYFVGAVLVVGGTLFLVSYLQGYSYDLSTGKMSRRGLVLINSIPGYATVTRSHNSLHKRTNYRATYEPGTYHFKVTKAGYRDWEKDLTVIAGEVTDARYIVMVPNTLKTTTPLSTQNPMSLEAISRDHRHLAYVANNGVWTLDLPGGTPHRAFAVPTPAPGTAPEGITSVTWSADATHLLVATQGPSGAIYRVMEASGNNATNLTSQYQFDFNGLAFSLVDWRLLYFVGADGNLRRLGSQGVSGVVAAGVSQFSFAADRILYLQSTPLGRSLVSQPVRGGDPTQLIQALPQSSTYQISYVSYQGDDNLVIIPSDTHEAILYTGVFGSSPVSTTIARGVDKASFSPDGHLVALYSAGNLVTYDLERSTATKIITYTSPALGAPLTALDWFDANHLLLNLGGKTVFSDFDGTNRFTFGNAVAGSQPFGSSDAKSAYLYEPTAIGTRLVDVTVR